MKVDVLVAEAWQAWRNLLRRPAYLALATMTLTLGVAAISVVFTLVDQSLLRPLPFPQAGRLVTLGIAQGDDSNIGSPLLYSRLRGLPGLQSIGLVTAYQSSANLSSVETPVVASTLSANRGFLETLGLPLALGRNFSADEDRKNGPLVVLLSHPFWISQFGGDTSVFDRPIRLEGRAATVVGVLLADFQWPTPFDLLLPMQLEAQPSQSRTNEYIVARLRPEIPLTTLAAQTDASLKVFISDHRAVLGEDQYRFLSMRTYDAQPLKHIFTSASDLTLLLFAGAAACVLLIVTINLTNLTALRVISRSHAAAVRSALGAPTWRIAMPSLFEGLLVGTAGALLGVLLAWAGLKLLAGMVPPEWLRGGTVRFTWLTWAFAAAIGLFVALLAAALGAWRGHHGPLMRELIGGGRGGWSRSAGRLGWTLVVVQVALAVVLLTGAVLFARNLYALASVPMGFDGQSILTFSLSPIKALHPDAAAVDRQTRRILQRLQNIAGVEAAGASTNLPTGSQLNMPVRVADGRLIVPQYRPVSTDFLSAMRIPTLAGRAFSAQDNAGSEPVCLVSASFAERYLQGDPLGQIVQGPSLSAGKEIPLRIVGVVGDVHQYGPDQPPPPIIYVALPQLPDEVWTLLREFIPLSYVIRVRGTPLSYEPRLRAAMREIDPLQPIANVRDMQAVIAATTSQQKLILLLVGVFAVIALLLASVGLHAVTAVGVDARWHEFGVRAALGAQPAHLLRLVLKESGVQIVLGLLIGFALVLALSKAIESFLFGIRVADPATIGAVLAVLFVSGILASLAPALRAARVHPMQVLRTE